jgi:hypothetical protein
MVRTPNGRDKRKPLTSRISAQPVRILAVYMGAAGAKDPGQTTARANSRALLAAGGKAGSWNWQLPALLLSPQCRNIGGNFRRLPRPRREIHFRMRASDGVGDPVGIEAVFSANHVEWRRGGDFAARVQHDAVASRAMILRQALAGSSVGTARIQQGGQREQNNHSQEHQDAERT